jgi:IS5 family transposase
VSAREYDEGLVDGMVVAARGISGEIRDILDELRKGVEKDQRIIADLKYRKAELEKRLLATRRAYAEGARDERARCIAELERERANGFGTGTWGGGRDAGLGWAIDALKARR